eukprot:gene17327-22871_t
MIYIVLLVIFQVLYTINSQGSSNSNRGEVSGYCYNTCNDLKTEVLTLSICREAKRTLPRPKVGDFCSIAMEQAFNDVCQPLCMSETPVVRISQTCRGASMEMPRPTVLKWCEHGYKTAYDLTYSKLFDKFNEQSVDFANEEEEFFEEEATNEEPSEDTQEIRNVRYRIPILIGEETLELIVYEGQDIEEAVVIFCRENESNADELGDCINRLVVSVNEAIESL